MAEITCWYNRTMEFHISQARQGEDCYPLFYHVCGQISSGSLECITLPGNDDSEVVALLGNPHQGHNVWGIATGQNAVKYSQINQTSCEVGFHKRLFGVAVDSAARLITVTALQDQSGPTTTNSSLDFLESSSERVVENAMQEVGMMVQVSGSPTFTPLGSGK
jgi:hypothetical protein